MCKNTFCRNLARCLTLLRPTANDGVACKHGAEECMGNIIELCAAYLYPEPRIYLGFVMCLTRDYDEIPDQELVQDCALEHGIDFDKLNACSSSDDGFGIEMLRKSVTRSKEVRSSCFSLLSIPHVGSIVTIYRLASPRAVQYD